MDQSELRAWEARCIQEEPPACRAGCPIGVDARSFVQAVVRDDLRAARAVLDKTMPMPGVTARLCEAPCEQFCVCATVGGSVAIGALERYCARYAESAAKLMRLPPRPKSVTVIGAAPSGLTVASDLAKKGYPVTILHSIRGPGGWLRNCSESMLPGMVLEAEIERLRRMGVVFTPVVPSDRWPTDSNQPDAWFVSMDDELVRELIAEPGAFDPQTFALKQSGWFGGGSSVPGDRFRFITDVAQGREAATSIDRFLQGASLTASRLEPRHGRTGLYTNTEAVVAAARVEPVSEAGYEKQEALREAGRCLDCQCLECVRACVYLKNFKGYPKTYARQVYNNSAIVKGTHLANRLINSCSLCGQCTVLCPHDFSMADLCLEARQTMVREGRMPPSAHWFAREEMRSVHEAAFIRHAPGTQTSTMLLFPGCQLAGIRPEQTLALYEMLLRVEPHTGIWYDCCGAPVWWAGRLADTAEQKDSLKRNWEAAGQPAVVTGCSTCLKMFREQLPEITADSVWNVLAERLPERGAPAAEDRVDLPPLALSDPCTTRHDDRTRASVRLLVRSLAHSLAPLPKSESVTECCGFGGLMDNANPELSRRVCEERVAQSPAPFLTYCAMCRDQLARTGKPTLHLLDLLLPDLAHDPLERPVSISARRVNRKLFISRVKQRVGETEREAEPWQSIRLVMTEDVAAQMEQRRILEDDVRQVLWQANRERSCFVHHGDGRKLAAGVIGPVTFWVEFIEEHGSYLVQRVWSHRMSIGGGNR